MALLHKFGCFAGLQNIGLTLLELAVLARPLKQQWPTLMGLFRHQGTTPGHTQGG